MTEVITIKVATQFGTQPYGRRADDGALNGEAFRHRHLIPALRAAKKVIIELDGNETPYGSSFLEEAFGGLIRFGYFTYEEIKDRIEPRYHLKNVPDRISHYLKAARREKDPLVEERLKKEYGE